MIKHCFDSESLTDKKRKKKEKSSQKFQTKTQNLIKDDFTYEYQTAFGLLWNLL